jgi:large conductance mechanosensitive channel
LRCEATVDAAGNRVPAVAIGYGVFINTVIDFVIIAFAIFMVVKLMSFARKQAEPAAAAPPPPTEEEQLLGEIRDILKARG